jgi:hypothetical protein
MAELSGCSIIIGHKENSAKTKKFRRPCRTSSIKPACFGRLRVQHAGYHLIAGRAQAAGSQSLRDEEPNAKTTPPGQNTVLIGVNPRLLCFEF